MRIEAKWLSAHLHYAEPLDVFLKEAIHPFVKRSLSDSLTFFFIRYWEEGDHIRLRVKVDSSVEQKKLHGQLMSFFSEYFIRKPSKERLYWRGRENYLKKNNKVYFVSYEPEVERYGGISALAVCERQFVLSSKLILKIICERGKWKQDLAIGVALQFHILFLKALELERNEAVALLKFVFNRWLEPARGVIQLSDGADVNENDLVEAFESAFNLQNSKLKSMVESFWTAGQDEIDDSILREWFYGNRQFGKELNLLLMQEKVNFVMAPNGWQYDKSKFTLWNIYESLIHMTNNRLGINNRDESYIAFVLLRCLQGVTKKIDT